MDASFSGWGVVLNAHPVYSLWERCHVMWHLITWKTRSVFLAMKILSPISVRLPCFGPVGQHIGSLKGRLFAAPIQVGAADPALHQEQTALIGGSLYSRAF